MSDLGWIVKALDMKNIAEELDEDLLDEIGSELAEAISRDEESRKEWLEKTEEWTKLATQVTEDKTHPWPGSANVKYPLLTTAAMQFHARAYPALVNPMPVKADVLGNDPTGEKRSRADRVSKHMSFQVLHGMPNWEEHMDRMCMILPLVGLCFKKTYWSGMWQGPITELVMAKDLIVNYHAKDFETAPRKTHIQSFNQNEMIEYQRAGLFRDIDLHSPKIQDKPRIQDKVHGLKPTAMPEDEPYTVYECHTYLDLDDDDYQEPYIVTLEKDSGKILRIAPRFTPHSFVYDEEGDLVRIKPMEHFTRFAFIPDPDSNIYALGFGHLLGPLNQAANTLINQLIDAGTLSNMQSGFLAKGIRLKGGSARFRPGEWKYVNTPGEDLHKNIYPLPVREPSNVLYQLLGTIIESGQQMSSVTDIMVGENPGQNQPASTTMAVMEQGMKVFTGIYKRLHRALSREYKKLYVLNSIHTEEAYYFRLLDVDEQVYEEDYQVPYISVVPSADPEAVTDTQKLLRSEALFPLVQMGTVNPQEATRRHLEAQGHDNIDALMQMPEPQPDPEIELEQQKFEHQRKMDWAKLEIEALKAKAMSLRNETSALQNVANAKSTAEHDEIDKAKAFMEEIQQREDLMNQRIEALSEWAQQQGQEQPDLQQPERQQQPPRTDSLDPGMPERQEEP